VVGKGSQQALRCGYRWASDRSHRFILQGMADNARHLAGYPVRYYPYVELTPDADKGLLAALAKSACVVITDDFPCFFLPRMVSSASQRLSAHMEKVDSNGLLPLAAGDRVFPTAYAFRRFLQKHLPSHLIERPIPNPLKGVTLPTMRSFPAEITRRWPAASPELLRGTPAALAALPIDHHVGPVSPRGGPGKAQQLMKNFVKARLSHYLHTRNEPEEEGASGLSPYLHFGHISAYQLFDQLAEKEGWFFDRLSGMATGHRSGWWGMSAATEAFLDQLVTWRELGFNMCAQWKDYDSYKSLPEWALTSLSAHEMDERPYVYALDEFERGSTHDPLWNAAQMQLVREGRIHNYLRMLWGKKILEWSASPKEALRIMIELNNKYAIDGRDPNSYSGIFWVLGRYDRAWGPERPIFGKVRYMSSKNTARKVRVRGFIEKYGP
jgi:deoxyribodipyrimidine photo-lyase